MLTFRKAELGEKPMSGLGACVTGPPQLMEKLDRVDPSYFHEQEEGGETQLLHQIWFDWAELD